jgi:hypothetical protein
MLIHKKNYNQSILKWSTIAKLSSIGTIIFIISIFIFTAIYDNKHPLQCVASSKVVDILSLEYRDATIKLENGKVVSVNQATLKKGDNYCLAYERKK